MIDAAKLEQTFRRGNIGQILDQLNELSGKLPTGLSKEATEIGFLVEETQRRLSALKINIEDLLQSEQ